MRNKNQAIIRKMVKKNLISNLGRNIFLVIAIFMTTFMIATIMSLCVNQIELQRIYTARYSGGVDNEIEPIIYVLAAMVFILMISGFLFIYNMMSVSVSREIRFYGLLRTIGMSSKQIKKMVLQQIVWLCAIGIPLGVLFSTVTSLIAVPMFISMYTQFSEIRYSISVQPLIFIGATIFVLITAIVGAYMPAKKAAQVSPMEAIRFSEYGYLHLKIRTSAFRPVKMAFRNVFRAPKRAVLVFLGLFLGMTMFMTVSIILGSTNVDKYAKQAAVHTKGDIYLRNDKAAQYSFGYVFDAELMNNLEKLPGLTEMNESYFHEIRMDITDAEGTTDNMQGYLYGVDVKTIRELSKELKQPIDENAFQRGEFVLVRDIWKNPLVDTKSATFFLENYEEQVSFPIGGILPSEFQDYFGTNYNRLPCVYMSVDMLKELVGEAAVYDVALNIKGEEQKQALQLVKNMIAGNTDITLSSEIEIREEAETIHSVLNVIGNTISAIVWLIGVLNFINIITVSILSRRHEFALLESVGQSEKQSKETLLYEGLIYAVVTLMLVGIPGSAMIYGLYLYMAHQFEYMVFTFPFITFSIMIVLIGVICLGVPQFVYRIISKATIVDRLKEVE